jgi:hypothetical protein
MLIGSRLIRYSGSPEVLRSAQIKHILQVRQFPIQFPIQYPPFSAHSTDIEQLLARIVAGMTCSSVAEDRDSLLEKVLLPLHTPNGMVVWRDQVSVVQVVTITPSLPHTHQLD